jgi:hypothetical protein
LLASKLSWQPLFQARRFGREIFSENFEKRLAILKRLWYYIEAVQ